MANAEVNSSSGPPAWVRRATRPPRYHDGRPISREPMGDPAELVFNEDGTAAWDRIWDDFCDLGLAGGPPHRATMLGFPTPAEVLEHCGAYERVVGELVRALPMVTGWQTSCGPEPGRIELMCPTLDAAAWMEEAIIAENVMAQRRGASVYLPAGPAFQVNAEIKNVVTAVAKTFHYWDEHRTFLDEIRTTASAARSGSD